MGLTRVQFPLVEDRLERRLTYKEPGRRHPICLDLCNVTGVKVKIKESNLLESSGRRWDR
jgi:hypothetical protein